MPGSCIGGFVVGKQKTLLTMRAVVISRWACVLFLNGCGILAQAQSAQIPKSCQSNIEPVSGLLRAVADQPTAMLFEQLGIAYGRTGNPKCAIAAFHRALDLEPGRTQSKYELALALIEAHAPAEAAEQLHAVIANQPDSFAAHNVLGLAFQDLGRTEDAANEFQTAIRIKPDFALAYYDLAQLRSAQKSYRAAVFYLTQGLSTSPSAEMAQQMRTALAVTDAQLGNYDDAIPLFREASTAQPESAELHFDLATAYAHLKNYTDAVNEYREVLRLDPHRNDAQLLLAKALLNQSLVEESLPVLRDYVQHNPNSPEGLEVLGDALKESSHSQEAIDILQRAIRANPATFKAHYDLGAVLGRSNQLQAAIRELRVAVKLNPDSPDARYQLARLLSRDKEDAASKEQLARFSALKEEEERQSKAGFFINRASAAFQQGHAEEARENYEQALALQPHDPKLHYNLAIALSKSNAADEQRELRKAIELDPNFFEAHSQLGSSLLSAGRLAEAEHEFRVAEGLDPSSPEALNNLGTVFGREGKNEDAEKLFQRAIAADPGAPLGFVNLGLTLAAQKKYDDAQQQLHAALKLDPKNIGALNALGMVEDKTGHKEESVATFRELVKLEPNSADAHLQLGIALADASNLDAALIEFSNAIRLAPDSSLAYYNEGRAFYGLHRLDDAHRALESAVKVSPNYVDALLLLGVLEHSSPYATELFRRVIALDPGNTEARLYLGRNLLQEGKHEDAITQWKVALKYDPDNLSVLSSLARTLSQQKSPEAQVYLARLQAAQKKEQVSDRVRELNNFALHAAEQNHWAQAVDQMQQAIDICGQCQEMGVLRKNIGLIYAREGDTRQAQQQLQLALELLPGGPDQAAAKQALRQLEGSAPPQNQ